ncbi:hypothetical protein BDY21DRAFT_284409 [Lineolata rhizophorae]|uniref:Zn(2)-C6 fungal-type domain-containing protein n=1 Tax=Lineolata rhizophorae TaxID=578093 RepID=A0A6A6P2V8_9PEZI|nr:hypothetical protein BDY21DRAFT_284409 [Lineolata rhizophorae]
MDGSPAGGGGSVALGGAGPQHGRNGSVSQYTTATAASSVSPTSARAQLQHNGSARKRTISNAGLESSPSSSIHHDEDLLLAGDELETGGQGRRRHTTGGTGSKRACNKRACNQCKQQKLRCNVQEEPFEPCSRCKKQNLECRIDDNFQRVAKRSRHLEMEREIELLRQQNQLLSGQMAGPPNVSLVGSNPSHNTPNSAIYSGLPAGPEQFLGSHEAAGSLLDLKQGIEGYGASPNARQLIRSLEDVVLAPDRIQELFVEYWNCYHPFLPLLDNTKSPDQYFASSQILFWTIISIASRHFQPDTDLLTKMTGPFTRLLWTQLSKVPQDHHIVRALCLLCAWPFPTSSTSSDPTFMYCGLMMQIAMQIGLHHPSHAQDFSRFHVRLQEEDIQDRVRTWTACNIVAQSVSTGYGQPSQTIYGPTLAPRAQERGQEMYQIPEDLSARLEIARFCNIVTKSLYSSQSESVRMTNDDERANMASILAQNLADLESRLTNGVLPLTVTDTLYLHSASLHLRLWAFFDTSSASTYRSDLLQLYHATKNFLEMVFSLRDGTPGIGGGESSLIYATNYLMQMTLAAGFTLFKLLNSFFARQLPGLVDEGKRLLTGTIQSIREMSVTNNDLPQRLAEVLAQLWRASPAAQSASTNGNTPTMATSVGPGAVDVDDSLQLRVRCRQSMSLVFDSVWRWRDEIQGKSAAGNLDNAVNNPTNPEASSSSTPVRVLGAAVAPLSESSTSMEPALPSLGLPGGNGIGGASAGFAYPNASDMFDTLGWFLDGVDGSMGGMTWGGV